MSARWLEGFEIELRPSSGEIDRETIGMSYRKTVYALLLFFGNPSEVFERYIDAES